jgi:hypothetical protein
MVGNTMCGDMANRNQGGVEEVGQMSGSKGRRERIKGAPTYNVRTKQGQVYKHGSSGFGK